MDHFEIGNVEIGADEVEAMRRVVAVARDSRQIAPDMRAVSPEDPEPDESMSAWFADIAVGACCAIGAADPFPIMTRLMTRFGAAQHRPRYVRVDTSDTYTAFCAECSPEMAELRARVAEVADRLEAHARDPEAHAALAEHVLEVEAVGAELASAERAKEIDLQLPPHLAALKKIIRAWVEGDRVCASLTLPGSDGDVRVCTSMMPVDAAVEEAERYAAAANVPAHAIVGHIPWMGCALGAATLLKEMAAAAPSILQRPEASARASFVCRIEPKDNPALCALDVLARMCRSGDPQARAEWDALAEAAGRGAPQVAQAMREAARACFGAGGA